MDKNELLMILRKNLKIRILERYSDNDVIIRLAWNDGCDISRDEIIDEVYLSVPYEKLDRLEP